MLRFGLETALPLKGFRHTVWSALWAPPDTPEAIVQQLTRAVNAWIISPESLTRLADNASRPIEPRTPAQNIAFQLGEYEKLMSIIKALKIEPQ